MMNRDEQHVGICQLGYKISYLCICLTALTLPQNDHSLIINCSFLNQNVMNLDKILFTAQLLHHQWFFCWDLIYFIQFRFCLQTKWSALSLSCSVLSVWNRICFLSICYVMTIDAFNCAATDIFSAWTDTLQINAVLCTNYFVWVFSVLFQFAVLLWKSAANCRKFLD